MTPEARVEKCFEQITYPLDSLDIEILKLSMEAAIREAVKETVLGIRDIEEAVR